MRPTEFTLEELGIIEGWVRRGYEYHCMSTEDVPAAKNLVKKIDIYFEENCNE